MSMSHDPNNIPPNQKGKIKMFIKDKSKWVLPDEQYKYELLGYDRNSRLINDGIIMKRIALNSLDYFLNNGWRTGKIKKEKI